MANSLFQQTYSQTLTQLKKQNQFRSIPSLNHQGRFVTVNGVSGDDDSFNRPLINIASNDYLGIGADGELQDEFLDFVYHLPKEQRPRFGSTSSRLLTGNDIQLELLEQELAEWYNGIYSSDSPSDSSSDNQSTPIHSTPTQPPPKGEEFPSLEKTLGNGAKSALIFNSGYHSNLGILPALTSIKNTVIKNGSTLILADKLVHASIIDGMRLAQVNNQATFKRYRHNDHAHLRKLISQAVSSNQTIQSNQAKESAQTIKRIIIVTESIFSMDGDIADLTDLVTIKRAFTSDTLSIELYVDEAHAVGVLGKRGLGLCEVTDTLADIDYLVGTFGKAFASMGAYLICSPIIKDWLINSMRPLIYSTALPPMTHAWSRFVLQKMVGYHDKRIHLASMSQLVKQAVEQKTGLSNPSQSPIIPYILGDNETTVHKAKALQQAGFYALPIRPPTVPPNTARIRLVINAGLDVQTYQRLIQCL